MTSPNSSWPLPSLMTSLANAGWGDLAGRPHSGLRATLRGLEALLPHGSAKGHGTVWQVAQRAGLSERWTRRCLTLLEDLGIIRWQRGTIIDSKPQPSHFTVVKAQLVRLIRIARGEASRRLNERRKAFLVRLQGIKNASLPRYNWQKAHSRAALGATRTHIHGGTKGGAKPPRPAPASLKGESKVRYVPPPQITPELMPRFCPHFGSYEKPVIFSCPDCRAKAITPEAYAEYDAAKLQAQREETAARSASDTELANYYATKYPGLTGPTLARAVLKEARNAK